MDDIGGFDPKMPCNDKVPDWRTSTYRGHRHITNVRMAPKLSLPKESTNKGLYVHDPLMHEKPLTEVTENFVWKYSDPNAMRNPSLNMKMHFMKRFEGNNLKFVKRNIKPITSVTHDTYTYVDLPYGTEPDPIQMPTPVQTAIEPLVTTYQLSYAYMSPRDLESSIARKDTITLWNWEAPSNTRVSRVPDATMCDETNAQQCPRRRLQFQNQLKCVPNTGLRTEVRDNYLDPKMHKEHIEYDTTDVRPILTSEQVTPFVNTSEYSVYGSGNPVLKYV